MNYRSKVRYSKLALGLAIALASAPAMAQNTTANIGGRVTAGESAVPGAQVVITHIPSGTSAQAVSDASGRYAARGLRVGGPYIVTITKDGKTETIENVFLQLAQTTQVDAAIGASAETTLETVEVTADNLGATPFSSTAMGAGTTVTSDQLESFASIQRSLQDYARLDPRLSQSDKSRSEISAAGQNSRYNSVTIDGVNTSDSFGLESNNLPTIKQPISIDAIQEVQVNISNYDVTQKGYVGANINAVTKSGTNELRGSLYHVYRNDDFYGENAAGAPFAGITDEKTWGLTLGGPLVKDRLFFFLSYEDFRRGEQAPDFGPIGSGASNIVNITPQQITDVQNIARTTWGMGIGEPNVPDGIETRVEDILLKLDWNISDNHRATFRYNKTDQSDVVYPGFNSSRLSLSSNWYSQGKTFESYVGEWFADWSDVFSTEAKVSYRGYESVPTNFSRLPTVTVTVVDANGSNRSLLFGTDQFRHANELITDTYTGYFAGTLFAGDHEIKAGFDYDRNEVFNLFLDSSYGVYTFGCVNSSATYTYSFGAVNCATSSVALRNQAILENFRLGRYSFNSFRTATSGNVRDAAADFTLENYGFFLQDTWAVNYNLTLMAGLRYDLPNVGDKPIFNQDATTAFGIRNDATIDGNGLFQPRLGFNYTFDTDRPTQLRGGIGLFQGAAANVWLANPFTNNGRTIQVFGCSGSACNVPASTVGTRFNPNPDSQPRVGGNPVADVDLISSELEQPSLWKANLAFDTELPWGGLVAQAELLLTRVESAIAYEHLNLGGATRQGSDGRNLYWSVNGLNPNNWSAAGVGTSVGVRALRNPSFRDVLLAKPTSKGEAQTLTLALSRPMRDDWAWSLGYNYTNATEVSPLTSSRAISNWDGRAVFNPNEEVAGRANYEIRDRFVGSVSWQKYFFDGLKTSFAVFYEGRSGRPYSWTYNNDLNGDGIDGNDLMYIPTGFGSGEVAFRGGVAEEQRFWDIVNANGLNRFAGGVVDRNSGTNPWVNSFDLRISQELPGFFEGDKFTLALDVLNVGNLLNKDWGLIDEITFAGGTSSLIPGNNIRGGFTRSFVNYAGVDAQGRYVYSLQPNVEGLNRRDNFGQSRWAAQLTLRYSF
jgi:hypothetical protein